MRPHIFAWFAPLILAGCNVPAWGNLGVLAVTLGLFCATLSLGRHIPAGGDQVGASDQKTFQQEK